jgi:hypothetical protein
MSQDAKISELLQSYGRDLLREFGLSEEYISRGLTSLGEYKIVRVKERSEKSLQLPWCGEVNDSTCQGIRVNHGLYTQCTGSKCGGSDYCTTCSKGGGPKYGNISTRGDEDFKYKNKVVRYSKVMEKLGITREVAEEAASQAGVTIAESEFEKVESVRRGRPRKQVDTSSDDSDGEPKKRGRPKKTKAVVAKSAGEDLIAQLMADAAVQSDSEMSEDSDASVVSSAEKQAEKQAAKEAAKQAKAAAKAAEKQAKLDAKAAEKAEKQAAKAAEKEAEKQAKLAAKEAEKQAKLAAKEAEKQAKLAAKEAEKQAKLDAKAAEKAEKQAAKAAEKEAEKQAKLDAKAAEKAEKQAAKAAEKEAEKQAKQAAKAAEKQAKLEAKEVENATEAATPNAKADKHVSFAEATAELTSVENAALAEATAELTSVENAAMQELSGSEEEPAAPTLNLTAPSHEMSEEEEEDDDGVEVEEFSWDGKDYIIDPSSGVLYDKTVFEATGDPEEVGHYCSETKTATFV